MAIAGQKVKGLTTSVASGSYVDIKPPSTEEWTIHNIKYSGAIELYDTTNGTDQFKVFSDTSTSGGGLFGYNFNLTNSYYIRIKSTSAAISISWDGICTMVL